MQNGQITSKTILLVEDEAIIALGQKAVLERAGYEVIHAPRAAEAIETALAGQADLILMDIDLGNGPDGTEAASTILERRDIPIVFLTSHTEKEYVDKTSRISSYGYVVKNSGEMVLLRMIEMAFRLFQANRGLKQAKDEWKETFDAIRDIVTVISPDFKILKINTAGCESLALPREHILGKNCYEIVHHTTEPIPECPCSSISSLDGPVTTEYSQDDRDYELIIWPLKSKDEKKGTSFVHIVKDIT